ncbi:MAG: pilus assembly protein FimV [Candidatus Puniceispirillum sp.]
MTAKHLLLACGLISAPTLGYAQSQPLIVLEYPNASQSGTLSDNPFVMDENYSTKHRVQSGETLSHVMSKHYAGSGLNSRFVEMAIVQKNKHAFVRGNKNFLYADKTLHLPSINEIKALIMGQSNDQPKAVSNSNQIYFFGS